MLDHILLVFLYPATVATPATSPQELFNHWSSADPRIEIVAAPTTQNVPDPQPRPSEEERVNESAILNDTVKLTLREPPFIGDVIDGGSLPPRYEHQRLARTRSQQACVHSGVPP